MRVAVYHHNNDIRVEERPHPVPGEEEILVRVESSGICGSDVMEWYRIRKAPVVLGHEIAGVITETGRKVDKFKPGDRVFVSHHVPCNTCRYCLAGNHSLCDTLRSTSFDPGGFSEIVRVPPINVDRGTFLLPDSISFDQGTFIEPLACVLRGLVKADFQPAQRVLILGSGISGLLHIKALRALGAGRVVATDIKDNRLEMARSLGADAVLHAAEVTPEKLRELNGGRLFDLVVTCAGTAELAEQSFYYSDRGGRVLFFAPLKPGTDITVPHFHLWRDQISVVSTYAGCPVDIERTLELLAGGRIEVDDLISHRLPLNEIQRGFQLVSQGTESVKVIIKPQE